MRLQDLVKPKPAAKKTTKSSGEEMANPSGLGVAGISAFSGYIRESYNPELNWPTCIPLYNRIWRSDPEVGIARLVLDTLASQIVIGAEIPPYGEDGSSETQPTDGDKRARDFLQTILDDIEGGVSQWLSDCIVRVPFYGWGWWEVISGIRDPEWVPPGDTDWRSHYSDGLIGVRKLAFRSYSSYSKWELNDKSEVRGFWQRDPSTGNEVLIPLNKSVHMKWGDMNNPEGLATLEALWRLERIKYGLEIVMGIGFEHSAGYLDVVAERSLTDVDKNYIKRAARAVMTAQEGNYALWPDGFKAELKDVPFSVADSLLEATRYYGILKLALFGLQWAALGSLSPYGSYGTIRDSSSFFIMTFNAMAKNFVNQLDEQLGKRIFKYSKNNSLFGQMTRRPRIAVLQEVQKTLPLSEMSQFLSSISALVPLGHDDLVAIKRASGFLPELISSDAQILGKEAEVLPENEPENPDEEDENGEGKEEDKDAMPQSKNNGNKTVTKTQIPKKKTSRRKEVPTS